MIILFLLLPSLIFGYHEQIDSLLERFSRNTTIVQLGSSKCIDTTKFIKRHKTSQMIILEDNNPHSLSKHDNLLKSFSKESFSISPILLNKRLYPKELKELSKSEYFDVTLILGKSYYTQSMQDHDESYVENLLNLSWHTFIECKYDSKQSHILHYHCPNKVFELDNGNFLFYFERNRKNLSKVHLLSKNYSRNILCTYDRNIEMIESDSVINARTLSRPLGLNVVNFKLFYGSFPLLKTLTSKATLKQLIGTTRYTHPHEVYINNNGYKIAAAMVPKKGERALTNDVLKSLFKATSQHQVKSLLYLLD